VALTELGIKAVKPSHKAQKLFDGDGLFLLVKPNGARLWRLKYYFGGQERLLSLGQYPEVTLRLARERRDEARRIIAAGGDPSAKRKAEKSAKSESFEAVSLEWLESKKGAITERVLEKRRRRFETFLFPLIGKTPVSQVRAPDLLAALRHAEARGKRETAHRLRSEASAVLRYAIATGRAERDAAADLRGALMPVIVRTHPAITEPTRMAELLRAIHGYRGSVSGEYALKILPYVFVRPGELRLACWREFDLSNAVWRIPAERMKMREQHIVPLAKQVVRLFQSLREVADDCELVFPSPRSSDRAISNNTMNAALRQLGFSGDEIVSHGFRSMASTRLNEMGWDPDLIELQLAHADRNEVRAAYNRAQRLVDRTRMMQAWADYLDSLLVKPHPHLARSGARIAVRPEGD
jgi:integrase